MTTSIDEPYQKLEKQLKKVEVDCTVMRDLLDAPKENRRLPQIFSLLLEGESKERREDVTALGKENSESEVDSECESGAASEAESDNSSEAEIQNTGGATNDQNHKNAGQKHKSDGAKKRRRGQPDDLDSDQESSFGRRKRSRLHAGGRVSAFDDEDLRLVSFFRRISQLTTERQIESFKYIPPVGKKMMVGWMDLVESFQVMTLVAANR